MNSLRSAMKSPTDDEPYSATERQEFLTRFSFDSLSLSLSLLEKFPEPQSIVIVILSSSLLK
jgi:hypothetical protein